MIWMPQEISPSLAVETEALTENWILASIWYSLLPDRYVTFEVDTEKADGLKIPVTAVTEKEFYLIPLEYMVQGGRQQ